MHTWMQPLPALLIFGMTASAAALPSGNEQPATAGLGRGDQPAQEPAAAGTDNTIVRTYFKDGLRFETPDKAFQMKIGGRILFDTAFISTNNDYENAFGREEDAAGFRMARIYTEGSVNEQIDFRWQYDFKGGTDNKLKDLYIGMRDVGIGSLRIGQFKECFGLEQLTSLTNTTFMERGASDRLVPGRNIGAMLFDTNASKTMNWAAGIFRDDGSDTGQDTGDGEYALTGRISGTPIKDDATHLVHIGGSVSVRQLRDQAYVVDHRGESNLTQQTIAAVNVAAEEANLAGLEAAWVNGPLSLQGEYVMSSVDPVAGSDLDYNGYYLYASYFLTGESRSYKDSSGTFQKVRVLSPYKNGGGKGAWEVGFRLSGLDLDDGSTPGGQVDSITTGVNWYLNDYTRVMLNWVHESADTGSAGDGVADILQMRFQIDV